MSGEDNISCVLSKSEGKMVTVKLSRHCKHEEHKALVTKTHAGGLPLTREGGIFYPFPKKETKLEHREARLFFMKADSVIPDVTYFQDQLLLRSFPCSEIAEQH